MSKQIREVYGSVLAELGDTNENIVVLDADLSGSTKSALFGKAHPERFFNMGIAEQNMVATAAGMSTVGKIPFVNTFTVFLTSLGLLSARDQICYANLNVKFGGAYCGMSDALDGASHHATEDIAIMRALPNMKVIVPADAAAPAGRLSTPPRPTARCTCACPVMSIPTCTPRIRSSSSARAQSSVRAAMSPSSPAAFWCTRR